MLKLARVLFLVLLSSLIGAQPGLAGMQYDPGQYFSSTLPTALFQLQPLAAAGDSLVAGVDTGGSASVYSKAVFRGGYQLRNKGSFAVAGTRSDQIAAQIPLAAAAGAKLLVMDQGVNDIAQSVAETTLRSNVLGNFIAAKALGMTVIDLGLPPTNTTSNVPRYVAHEIWRKLWAAKNGVPHLDMWSPLATAAGAYQTGQYIDAVHYNTIGATIVGDKLRSLLDNPFQTTPPLLAMTDTGSDAGSFVNNAVSFGGVQSGSVPSGWYSYGTGGTYSVTAADAGDFGSWLRCAVSGGTNVGFQAGAVTLASLGWSIGDKLAIAFKIRWSDAGRALTVTGQLLGASMSIGQPVYQNLGGASGDTYTVYAEGNIIGGTTISALFMASGTGYFEVSRPIVVNLTKLGLS